MTSDQIEKVVLEKYLDQSPVQINFKTRRAILGLFIRTADYGELRSKNLWRIVSESNIEEYKRSKNLNLARIFNGSEFTKLGIV